MKGFISDEFVYPWVQRMRGWWISLCKKREEEERRGGLVGCKEVDICVSG